MNVEVSRRQFMGGAAAGSRDEPWRTRPRRHHNGLCQFDPRVEAFGNDRELATPAPTAQWAAASSCIRTVTSLRVRKPRSFTSKATRSPDQPRHLCPKGAALLEFVRSRAVRSYPQIRKPGSDKFEPISWDFALDRIAQLMKDDRDRNFIAKNGDGVTVNRWLTTGFLAASATSNETALATYKVVRGTGMLAFDNQARV